MGQGCGFAPRGILMQAKSMRRKLAALILGITVAFGLLPLSAAVRAAPAYAASADVWIDGAEVITYSDGGSGVRTLDAIRGAQLPIYPGNSAKNPGMKSLDTAKAYKWVYKDAQGAEQDFDFSSTPVPAQATNDAATTVTVYPVEIEAATATGPVIYLDPVNGSDGNNGLTPDAPRATWDSAFESVDPNGKIVATNLDKDWPASVGTTGNTGKAITLEIAEDTTYQPATTPAAGSSCIIIEKGSHLTVAPGKKLTMHGCQTAITIKAGGELNDGNYELTGNALGFNNHGLIKGSDPADNTKLTMHVDSSVTGEGWLKGRGLAWDSTTKFLNANITVKSDVISDYDGTYAGNGANLRLENTRLETEQVRFNLQSRNTANNLYMDNSYLSSKGVWSTNKYGFKFGEYGQGFALVDMPSIIKNGSTLVVDGGRMTVNPKLDVIGSTIIIKNSSGGGLNVNYGGDVTFTNSTLQTENLSGYPAFGAGKEERSAITFTGSSVVNTQATRATVDNGGARTSTNSVYVVTGGSHLIKEGTQSGVQTVPDNGAANGSEPLTRFKLAAPGAVTLLHPTNSSGAAYEYAVAKASSDGNKYVWVPDAKYTVKLNNPNAKFADGTTVNKTGTSIRGEVIGLVDGQADVPTQVGTPTSSGANEYFQGWYVQAGSAPADSDAPFNPTDRMDFAGGKLLADEVIIYAKWSNTPPPVGYTVTFELNGGELPAGTANPTSVLSTDSLDLTADAYQPTKPADGGTTYTFAGWYTDADLADEHAAGNSIQPTGNITLYAKWDEVKAPDENIYGDLLVQKQMVGGSAFDTEHTAKFPVKIDDELNFRLDVDARGLAVKLQAVIAQLEQMGIPGLNGDTPIENPQATAIATLTFPDGLSLKGTPAEPQTIPLAEQLTLADSSELFEIKEAAVSGQQLTVKVGFKDNSAMSTYNALLTKLQQITAPMQLTIPNIYATANLAEAADLKVSAAVEMQFAPNASSVTPITAIQSAAGVDYVLANGTAEEKQAIQLTLRTGDMHKITWHSNVTPGERLLWHGSYPEGDGVATYVEQINAGDELVTYTGMRLPNWIATPGKVHLFEGWYYDEALTQRAPYTLVPTGDMDLYAKWYPDETQYAETNGYDLGDLLIRDAGSTDFDTTADAAHQVDFGGSYDVRGTVTTYHLKRGLAATMGGLGILADTTLESLDTEITAVYTFPEALDISSVAEKVTFSGAEDLYEIKQASVNGQRLTVELDLKEGLSVADFPTFGDLDNAVRAADNTISIDLPGVKLKDSAQPSTKYVINGELSGFIKVGVPDPSGSTVREGIVGLNVIQDDFGRDVDAADPEQAPTSELQTAARKLIQLTTVTGERSFAVTYEFTKADGVTQELPSGVTAALPGSDTGNYSGDTVQLANVASPITDATNHGTWSFGGWKVNGEGEAVTEVTIANANVALVGTWVFTEAGKHTVTYQYAKADGVTPELPTGSLPALPAPVTNYEHEAVTPPSTPAVGAEVADMAADGKWTFAGWAPAVTEIGSADQTVTGTWNFTPNTYTVSYAVSGEAPADAPAAPWDAAKYTNGQKVNVAEKLVSTATSNAAGEPGAWSFDGWKDASGKIVTSVTVAKANVALTGAWVFTPKGQHTVSFAYAPSTAAGTPALPADFPAAPASQTAYEGATVNAPAAPTDFADSANDGVWSFDSWSPAAVTVGTSDATITGTWNFTPNQHTVSYKFMPAAGAPSELPSGVTNQKPADAKGVKGAVVESPTAFNAVLEADNDGTWVFDSWDKSSVQLGTSDQEVTGTWKFTKAEHTVSFKFAAALGAPALPEAVANLLPAEQKRNKGDVVALPSFDDVADAVNDGTWAFQGWDPASLTVGNSDASATGTWAFTPNKHSVKYEWAKAAGAPDWPADFPNAPAAVTDKVKGDMVASPAAPADVRTDAGVWSFDGWSADSVTVGTGDSTVTGTWSFSPAATPLEPIAAVTPVAPSATDPASCTVKPHVIIPASTYFDYVMDGKVVTAGTHYYEYGAKTVVTAALKAGYAGVYELAEDAPTEWTWTAPTLESLQCNEPEQPEKPGEQDEPGGDEPGQPGDPENPSDPVRPGTQPDPSTPPTNSTLRQIPATGAQGIGALLGPALLATAGGASLLAWAARRRRG